MGEVIWIEVLGRGGEVAARHRLADGDATIGRAYDNSIIVDDPTVAPHHLRIARDGDGRWRVEDCGSVNGLHVDGGGERVAAATLAGRESLRIGRTLLRVRAADHPVAPELPLAVPWLRWPLVGWLGVAVFACTLLRTWLAQTVQTEAYHYVLPLGALATALVVWVGFWALMSRIFAGHAWVERHAFIALTALALDLAIDAAWALVVYAFALPVGAGWEATLGWLFAAAVVFAHLTVIGSGHLRIKVAAVLVMAATGIGLQIVGTRQFERMAGGQLPSVTLLPPMLRVVGGIDDATFFSDAAALKAVVDRARSEEPAGNFLPDNEPAQ